MSGRIIVVDSCPIAHKGLASIVRDTEFTISLATESVREAADWLDSQKVEIVLCDFELKDGSSGELQKNANRLKVPLVLFSAWQNPVFVSRMVEAGAFGLIDKTVSTEQLLSSLRKVLAGKKIWKRQDTRRVTGALATPRLKSHIDFPLTQREFEVLTEMSTGQTNKMVAEKMGISYETVKEHMQHVLVKLGVSDRTQAAILAVRRGLL